MSVWAAILAGGSGTRFWPLSTPQRPKQLLPLAGDRPLLVQAVDRLDGLVPPERVLILTGPFLVDQVAAVVPQIPRPQILAEPRAASTAPALAWAAQWISQRDPGAQMLSLHADWAVRDDRAFRAAGRQALGVAAEYDVLVTVGVKPTRNETGYGYIIPAKTLGGARTVRRFLEKPSPARAALLRRQGALWNTGLFAWGVARFLGEAGAYARELKPGWPALTAGDVAGFFAAVRPVAVDGAVLERTKRLAGLAGTFALGGNGSSGGLLRSLESPATFARPHPAGFAEAGVPLVTARRPVPGPAVIGSSTFAPRGLAPSLPEGAFRLTSGGVTVGWGVGAGATWDGPQPHAAAIEVPGVVLHGTYDLVPALEHLLQDDLRGLLGDSDPLPMGSTVLGDPAAIALRDAAVEPGVVFDVRNGPVVLESGAEVRAGSRLEGPLWIGANAHVLGGPLRPSGIGPRTNARGELSNCVFLGYANKAHDGFGGHCVIGRGANLGAGTIPSNLKNTDGRGRLEIAGMRLETGLQLLGSLIGDHAKTAIGTLLSTGTVIGTGANVFHDMRPPKYIPPFAWGGAGGARMSRDGFLKIAGRVLPRRDVVVDDATRAVLERIYDWATR